MLIRSVLIATCAATLRRKNFTRYDENGYSFVYKQPETPEEIELCEEALLACPVEAIGDDG